MEACVATAHGRADDRTSLLGQSLAQSLGCVGRSSRDHGARIVGLAEWAGFLLRSWVETLWSVAGRRHLLDVDWFPLGSATAWDQDLNHSQDMAAGRTTCCRFRGFVLVDLERGKIHRASDRP